MFCVEQNYVGHAPDMAAKELGENIERKLKMKKQLFFAVAVSFLSISASAQSSFAGFYGQISTGYEGNQLSKIGGSSKEVPSTGHDVHSSSPSQNFGGAPLMLGVGYYWQAHSSWLVGIGVDYSAISQTSPYRQGSVIDAPGSDLIPAGTIMTTDGAKTQLSNRYNIFVSPAYAIDKEKLLYAKAGYSQVNSKGKRPTTVTVSANGKTTTIPTTTAGTYDNTTVGGYLIGIGYRQIITNGLYGFVEANYMGYNSSKHSYSSNGNSASKSGVGFSSSSVTNITASSNLNSYQLLVGVGYAF